jgi:hypothetical protein
MSTISPNFPSGGSTGAGVRAVTLPDGSTLTVDARTGLPVSPPAAFASDADLAQAINGYIARNFPNSPLKGLGNKFVTYGRKYNVDPTLLVGIAQQESGLGTYAPAHAANNFFGMGGASNFQHYTTIDQGFDAAAKLAGQLGAGNKVLSDFLGSWNHGPNAHQPDPEYAKKVAAVMAAIGGHPMSTVSPGSTNVSGGPVDTGYGPQVLAAVGSIGDIFSGFLDILKAIFSMRGLLFIIGAFLAIVALVIMSRMIQEKSPIKAMT